MIFVFGSNLAGRHGAGAAKYAVQHHGATYGKGWGLQGNSFAIPTKDANIKTLPLSAIETYVDMFKDYARVHTELAFQLTPIGCGLAGYKYEDIGPMFKNCPSNVAIPKEFEPYV
jgi:hypothetical protein